jgi:hypothetical protein
MYIYVEIVNNYKCILTLEFLFDMCDNSKLV